MTNAHGQLTGAVAIGRNEGERLRVCLQSLVGQVVHVVYVDSGSSDGSVALAQGLGVQVVALDMAKPFTAARARNAGWVALLQARPDLRYVQFVDGDCEVLPGWLPAALAFFASAPAARRGVWPSVRALSRAQCVQPAVRSRMEHPVGDAKACGGDALMRTDALQQVQGYRDSLIAGEEPELCLRLRQQGRLVHRLGVDMTLHDAAITRFGNGGGVPCAVATHLPKVLGCMAHRPSGTGCEKPAVRCCGGWRCRWCPCCLCCGTRPGRCCGWHTPCRYYVWRASQVDGYQRCFWYWGSSPRQEARCSFTKACCCAAGRL